MSYTTQYLFLVWSISISEVGFKIRSICSLDIPLPFILNQNKGVFYFSLFSAPKWMKGLLISRSLKTSFCIGLGYLKGLVRIHWDSLKLQLFQWYQINSMPWWPLKKLVTSQWLDDMTSPVQTPLYVFSGLEKVLKITDGAWHIGSNFYIGECFD